MKFFKAIILVIAFSVFFNMQHVSAENEQTQQVENPQISEPQVNDQPQMEEQPLLSEQPLVDIQPNVVVYPYEPGWFLSGGYWYYFKQDGSLAKGWLNDGVHWYFLDLVTGAMKTGWLLDGANWYYLNSSGAMQTGWLDNNGNRYYLSSSGAMVTGIYKVGVKSYIFNSSGAMIKQSGFINFTSYTYYLNTNYEIQTGWIAIGGFWYYMDSSGQMQTGWISYNNYRYYLDSPSGRLHTSWLLDGAGHWYYLDSEGIMKSGWLNLNGENYFLRTDSERLGEMIAKGWLNSNGTYYYFKSDGKQDKSSEVSINTQMLRLAKVAYQTGNADLYSNYTNWEFITEKNGDGLNGFNGKLFSREVFCEEDRILESEYCFAFRGTKQPEDFYNDLIEIAIPISDDQINSSIGFVNENKYRFSYTYTSKVYFTGHSLGGFLSAWNESDVVDDKIDIPRRHGTYSVTFNAPGIMPNINNGSIGKLSNPTKYDPYILNHYIYDNNIIDPISNFMFSNKLGSINGVKFTPASPGILNLSYHDLDNYFDAWGLNKMAPKY